MKKNVLNVVKVFQIYTEQKKICQIFSDIFYLQDDC